MGSGMKTTKRTSVPRTYRPSYGHSPTYTDWMNNNYARAPFDDHCNGIVPGRVAQSIGRLTRKSGVLGSMKGYETHYPNPNPCSKPTTRFFRYPVWQHTLVSPSALSRSAVVNYWPKYVHEVLVNRLGGLSLPRKSVVRLTDRPDMFTVDVKTTIPQQQQRNCSVLYCHVYALEHI